MEHNNNLRILSGDDIGQLLSGKEEQLVQLIREAYISHEKGDSALPHSIFLQFPNKPKDRIIGLPAYINGTAGIKWIASFSENIERGMDRASATIILNSLETGRPYGVLEGSIISAKRTAASAALAAKVLSKDEIVEELSFVGCGLINFEILKFLLSQFKDVKKISLFDIDSERARKFLEKAAIITTVDIQILGSVGEVCKSSKIVSFATTASVPHVINDSSLREDAIILNISLRDFGPNIIKNSINVVDDLDHVNRENTSIHLASQMHGTTDFVTASLGELLLGLKTIPEKTGRVIFSPFGLGILDIQLAKSAYEQDVKEGRGALVENFIPENWNKRSF